MDIANNHTDRKWPGFDSHASDSEVRFLDLGAMLHPQQHEGSRLARGTPRDPDDQAHITMMPINGSLGV